MQRRHFLQTGSALGAMGLVSGCATVGGGSGPKVVVIGGGMTAVDAAVQSKLLGAQEVHMVYRRGPDAMSASNAEQEWAQTHGVTLHHWLAPEEIVGADGHTREVRFARQALVDGKLQATGETHTLQADTVLKAIGQSPDAQPLGTLVELRQGRIVADAQQRTTHAKVWAGGDCAAGGEDLTVTAVAQGRDAAEEMNSVLMGGGA